MTDDELLALCRSQEYHYDCEDCWYSCPRSGNCCNDTAGDECNCGYDRRVKEKMDLYKAGYRAGVEHAAKVCRDAAFSSDNVSAATMNNTILSIVLKWKEGA